MLGSAGRFEVRGAGAVREPRLGRAGLLISERLVEDRLPGQLAGHHPKQFLGRLRGPRGLGGSSGRWSSDADGPKLSMLEIFKSEDGQERFTVECDYIFAPEAGEGFLAHLAND